MCEAAFVVRPTAPRAQLSGAGAGVTFDSAQAVEARDPWVGPTAPRAQLSGAGAGVPFDRSQAAEGDEHGDETAEPTMRV